MSRHHKLLDFNILSTTKLSSKVGFVWRGNEVLYTLQKICRTDTQ